MKKSNSFTQLSERLKSSTQDAKIRHAEHGQPIVYKERNGNYVYEDLAGNKKVTKPTKTTDAGLSV